jgi:hypothetical protein
MPLWIPIGLFILWRYYANVHANTGDLTPERQAVYEMAMKFARDPQKLAVLADAFDSAGLHKEASALRKRSKLPSLPANVQAARQRALREALSSMDPDHVKKLAVAFEAEGLGSAAAILRDYASGLESAADVHPIALTPNNPAAPPPDQQLPHPESQVPLTQAGELMGSPIPMAATPAPVPAMPPEVHGEGFGSGPPEGSDFGLGTIIPSRYPGPLQPDDPGPIEEHMPPPIPR